VQVASNLCLSRSSPSRSVVLRAGLGVFAQATLLVRSAESLALIAFAANRLCSIIYGMVNRNLDIPMDRIEAFCRKWKIRELSLFGSVLRDDFRPDSDVDVLVSFEPDAPWDLFHLVEMRDELIALFGRDVDLVEKEGLRNPFRRRTILDTREVIYAA
jgi:predicted nucleotidyltransferase